MSLPLLFTHLVMCPGCSNGLEANVVFVNTLCGLCIHRYELPQPAAGQKNDISAWQDAVNNSCAQLEHQAGRYIGGGVIMWMYKWGRSVACVIVCVLITRVSVGSKVIYISYFTRWMF